MATEASLGKECPIQRRAGHLDELGHLGGWLASGDYLARLVEPAAGELALLHPHALAVGLVLAASLHLANAWLFGLNRFVWVRVSGYPALWCLQGRLLGGGG